MKLDEFNVKKKKRIDNDREKKREEKLQKKKLALHEKRRAQIERDVKRQMKPGECLKVFCINGVKNV